QIIAHESGVADTVDPLGGSYSVECLTREIEARVLDYLKTIDELGGMLRAIEVGFVQREIQEAAYRHQKEIEERSRIVVGLNAFTDQEPAKVLVFQIDPDLETGQRRRLTQVKESRDQSRVEEVLKQLEGEARGSENLLPSILKAVRAYATIGEICGGLRRVFGEHKESVTI
ncbi:MAG: methylmalonyl-CoA mutase, partial [candidate division NC10 bacterium]|nr:methylmalonyl-CoA mutase [candidate division NC10 bacterium]